MARKDSFAAKVSTISSDRRSVKELLSHPNPGALWRVQARIEEIKADVETFLASDAAMPTADHVLQDDDGVVEELPDGDPSWCGLAVEECKKCDRPITIALNGGSRGVSKRLSIRLAAETLKKINLLVRLTERRDARLAETDTADARYQELQDRREQAIFGIASLYAEFRFARDHAQNANYGQAQRQNLRTGQAAGAAANAQQKVHRRGVLTDFLTSKFDEAELSQMSASELGDRLHKNPPEDVEPVKASTWARDVRSLRKEGRLP